MSDWLNGDLRKFEKVVTRPIEEAEELYKSIPENAVITAETETLKTIRIKYVLTNDLTVDRIRELNELVKPIKLDRKNQVRDNSLQKQKRINCLDTVMAVINIADFHLNRKIWGKAGYNKDYTVKCATKVFKGIIDEAEVRLRACPYRVDKVILNTAGDFLNSDTIEGTTTHGTLQHNDVCWKEAYLVAQELLSYALLKLSNVAPVYYYYVAGNHDKMVGFYLTSWAKARFTGVPNIIVDDDPKLRQTVTYGGNVLIFSHGDNEGKRAVDLPFNEPEAKQALSEATNVEVLTGHGHSVKIETKNGVRLEMLNCSCPVGDEWSYEQAFGNNPTEATIMYYNSTHRLQQDTIPTKKFL